MHVYFHFGTTAQMIFYEVTSIGILEDALHEN